MRKLILALTVLLLSSCIAGVIPKDNGLLTHNKRAMRWKCKDLPIKLKIASTMPNEFIDGIVEAVAIIENKIGRDLFEIEISKDAGLTTDPAKVERGVTELRMANKAFSEKIIAITEFDYNGKTGIILSTIITFAPKCHNPRDTAIHELLHTLGLAHDSVRHSIMYKSIGNSQSMTGKDIGLLKRLYWCNGAARYK